MPLRICGSVIAGVHFFSPSRFRDQEPRRDQRQRLVVMPAAPVADFVVGQAGFTFGATQTFFDAVLGLGRASELGHQHVLARRDITQEHRDLTVLNLPQPTAPLPRDPISETTTDRTPAQRSARPVPDRSAARAPPATRRHSTPTARVTARRTARPIAEPANRRPD